MIGLLRGAYMGRVVDTITVLVGGVGYDVTIPAGLIGKLPNEGDHIELYIHMHVRENDVRLLGFLRPEERQVFRLLLGVNGVGPKGALNMLSLGVDEVVRAIAGEDAALLAKAPGVGRKTAERVIVDLAVKVGKLARELGLGSSEVAPQRSELYDDVVSALTNMDVKRAQAEKAVASAAKEVINTDDFGILFSAALRALRG